MSTDKHWTSSIIRTSGYRDDIDVIMDLFWEPDDFYDDLHPCTPKNTSNAILH